MNESYNHALLIVLKNGITMSHHIKKSQTEVTLKWAQDAIDKPGTLCIQGRDSVGVYDIADISAISIAPQ